MISHKLSQIADAAAARYDSVTSAWQFIFSNALASLDFGKSDSVTDVAKQAFVIAESHFAIEKEYIADALMEIATEAHQSVLDKIDSIASKELTDASLKHLSLTQSYISDEIIAQMHRDIALLRQTLQRATLDVSVISRSRNVPERSALIAYRIANNEKLDFVFRDRKARRTPSRTFIRALWRQTLLAAHNEVVMMTLSDHGISSAAVLRMEDGTVRQIDTIDLGGEDPDHCYGALCASYFHPNSNAWLDMEVVNV